MKTAVILFILSIAVQQAKAECKVVEYADRSEVVCEEATSSAAAPPPSYEERQSTGDVVKDGELFASIANEVSELILEDKDPDAVLLRMNNLLPLYENMKEATAKIAGKDRKLARVYEAQLTGSKELWAALLIASGRFMMKNNRYDEAKNMLRFFSANFQEQEFSKQVKQADSWLNDLNTR